MYAALVSLTIDPAKAPQAAEALTNEIIPRLRSSPGFVAGYWLEVEDGEGFAMVCFDTEQQARVSSPPSGDWSAPGVSIAKTEVRRVAATAP